MTCLRPGLASVPRTRRAALLLAATIACAGLGFSSAALAAGTDRQVVHTTTLSPEKLAELQALVRQMQAGGPLPDPSMRRIRGPSAGIELRLFQLLSERWSRCPVPSPRQARWPDAVFQPDTDPYSFVIPLPGSPTLRLHQHADRRVLIVGQDLGTLYVVEVTGYAQSSRVMGPLPVVEPCS